MTCSMQCAGWHLCVVQLYSVNSQDYQSLNFCKAKLAVLANYTATQTMLARDSLPNRLQRERLNREWKIS